MRARTVSSREATSARVGARAATKRGLPSFRSANAVKGERVEVTHDPATIRQLATASLLGPRKK